MQTHYLLTADEVVEAQWYAERSYLVAARDQLVCKTIDLSGVPAEAEEKYVAMQALRYSPFKEFEKLTIGQEESRLILWIWDADWMQKLRQQLPIAAKNLPVVPETLFRSRRSDGAFLVPCHQGFELQVWQDNRLVSSRWYPEEPKEQQLHLALRAEGVNAVAARVPTSDWLPRPWSERERDLRSLIRDEKNIFLAGVAVLLFISAVHFGFGAITSVKSQWVGRQIESLGEGVDQRLTMRNDLEQLRDENTELLSLFVPFSQVELLAEFTAALASVDYQLVDWNYTEGTLLATIRNRKLDTRDVVTRLEKRDLFHDLRIEPGNRPGESVIRIQIPDVNRYRLEPGE
ncbi:MAG: hypothetical protein AAF662_12755 [Pseudomonadota bacterium]